MIAGLKAPMGLVAAVEIAARSSFSLGSTQNSMRQRLAIKPSKFEPIGEISGILIAKPFSGSDRSGDAAVFFQRCVFQGVRSFRVSWFRYVAAYMSVTVATVLLDCIVCFIAMMHSSSQRLQGTNLLQLPVAHRLDVLVRRQSSSTTTRHNFQVRHGCNV
jgi:hypothetical protein